MSDESLRASRLIEILGGAGWFDGRHVSVEAALSAWRADGHTPSYAAIDFVAEFNGLSFAYPRSAAVGGMDNCSLDAIAATGAIFSSVVREYEGRTGETLCPVGQAASGHITLLVGNSGRVYGGYDRFLAAYGENGRTAIVAIYDRIRPVGVEG
jgi:hypothetical protein